MRTCVIEMCSPKRMKLKPRKKLLWGASRKHKYERITMPEPVHSFQDPELHGKLIVKVVKNKSKMPTDKW